MNQKNKYTKFAIWICICVIFCSIMLSSCSSYDITENDNSIALIKNAQMSTYGTGFALGIPGKDVDTIVTAYSVVATPNGVAPKTAEVSINEFEKNMTANVVYYDAARNIAVLKLPEKTKDLKSVILKAGVDYTEPVYVRGYDGTGNIMSDFEKFNTTDIVQYNGNISTYDELNTVVVYKYSNEFNRALVGAPAIDEKGNVIGMCAYSLSSMNTYSQYILSSDELEKLFSSQDIEFMTSEEVKYRNIMLAAVIIGLLLLIAIIFFTLFGGNKKENNLKKFKNKYIRVTDGILKGNVYKFEGKLVIGRDAEKCDIVYPAEEQWISAVHCTVQLEGNDCYLVDNFSQAGTFLENGSKVVSAFPHKIEDGKFVFYAAEQKNRFEFIDKKELR